MTRSRARSERDKLAPHDKNTVPDDTRRENHLAAIFEKTTLNDRPSRNGCRELIEMLTTIFTVLATVLFVVVIRTIST